MREREGEKLRDDVLSRLEEIGRLTGIVEQRSPQTVAEYRARLEQKLREALEGLPIDDARILTECAVFADKVAVDEETVRLRSHISQLRGMAEGRLADRPEDGLPHPGAQPRVEHDWFQVPERRHCPRGRRPQGEIEKIREQIQNVE